MFARMNPFTGNMEIVLSNITDYHAFPISEAIDGATAPAAITTLTSTNKVNVRNFQGETANQDVFFTWAVPSDLIPGITTIQFRVVFFITSATAPSEEDDEGVVFGLKGASLATDDALSSALGTAITVASGTLKGLTQYDRAATPWSNDVTITGLGAGETAILNFYRDQDHESDTYAQAVGVASIEIKFKRALN